MHDLDRQQLEQYEQEGLLGEYPIGELTEAQEMELASQFLEVTSEEELEQFFNEVAKRTAAGSRAKSTGRGSRPPTSGSKPAGGGQRPKPQGGRSKPRGKPKQDVPVLNRVTKALVKGAKDYVLPALGKAATAGLTAAATQYGPELIERAGQWIGSLFGGELEGLSGEDREFETARRYIRFAIEALQRALEVPPRVPPVVGAQVAVSDAARTHAPGIVPMVPELVGAAAAGGRSNGGTSGGRWVRKGSSIVVDLG